jgi:glycogen synthase
MQELFNTCKSINIMHHKNGNKDKNHITKSIDAEKAFNKMQHPFMVKALRKLGIERSYITTVKATYARPITLNEEKLEAFFKIRNGTSVSTFPTLTQYSP